MYCIIVSGGDNSTSLNVWGGGVVDHRLHPRGWIPYIVHPQGVNDY